MNIAFSPEIKELWPDYKAIVIEADIHNPATGDQLWDELSRFGRDFAQLHEMPDVNKRPGIKATREAYKRFGKEPNRYRPSCEALCRRMVKGMDLYRTLSVIDLINLLSAESGHSIGAFDADYFDGDTLTLGRGRDDEPYAAIGRGELNIAGMPIWRDATGGVGTPTSDNERTRLRPETKHLLVIINIFGQEMPEDSLVARAQQLLTDYASAKNIRISTHRP